MPFEDGLPINLDDLLKARTVESHRIEYKATWNDPIRSAAVRTVCAFANDILNLNGGYVVLGVEEQEGRPVLPPRGLDNLDLDAVQKDVINSCRQIDPTYLPLVFPVTHDGKSLLVIWAPGGDTRPYRAPDDANKKDSPRLYWVRQGPMTVEAKGLMLQQLLELTAKVPFDDRRHLQATIDNVSMRLVRNYLHDVRSRLAEASEHADQDLLEQMHLLARVNAHYVPRNVALLFFSEEPQRFFRGACTEVVQFGEEGDSLQERVFVGPVHQQVRDVLAYLDTLGGVLLQKVAGQAEVDRTVPYPYGALEEALVNAVYHRGYDNPEPIKVYLHPDRLEIINYPGPVPGVEPEHFGPNRRVPPLPARNRRIGEFLKELRMAESRGSGIPKIRRTMRENGNPDARFLFDPDRTWFVAELPVHPRYRLIHSLREATYLWTIGERDRALGAIEAAYSAQPSSGALAAQAIRWAFALEQPSRAQAILARFETEAQRSEVSAPFLAMAEGLIESGRSSEASEILARIPPTNGREERLAAAILRKRAHDFEGAHHLFLELEPVLGENPKFLHDFAETKIALARQVKDLQAKKRLNREAADRLRKAIQLGADPARKAWSWYRLAGTLDWLRAPRADVENAYLRARELLPGEPRFVESYEAWKSRDTRRKPPR